MPALPLYATRLVPSSDGTWPAAAMAGCSAAGCQREKAEDRSGSANGPVTFGAASRAMICIGSSAASMSSCPACMSSAQLSCRNNHAQACRCCRLRGTAAMRGFSANGLCTGTAGIGRSNTVCCLHWWQMPPLLHDRHAMQCKSSPACPAYLNGTLHSCQPASRRWRWSLCSPVMLQSSGRCSPVAHDDLACLLIPLRKTQP